MSPSRAPRLSLHPVLPFSHYDELPSPTGTPGCAVLPPTPPLTPLPLARSSPKIGELEYRISIHQATLSPPTPPQQGTLNASTSSSLQSTVSTWSVNSWLSTSSSYFPATKLVTPAIALILRTATLILIVVGWIVVANVASSTAKASAAANEAAGNETDDSKAAPFSFLPWCDLIFAVLLVLNLFYIRRSFARVYLPFRRNHLSTLPHLQRQLDPRWTDGVTLLYKPTGFVKVFEWSLGLKPATVLPIAPVPCVPGYEGHSVVGGLDEGTVEFMTERATRQGVAPHYASAATDQLLARGPSLRSRRGNSISSTRSTTLTIPTTTLPSYHTPSPRRSGPPSPLEDVSLWMQQSRTASLGPPSPTDSTMLGLGVHITVDTGSELGGSSISGSTENLLLSSWGMLSPPVSPLGVPHRS